MRITKYSMVCEKVEAYNDPGISALNAEAVARIFKTMYPKELIEERVALLCVNSKGNVAGFHEISKGSLTESSADIKQVLIAALNTPKTTACMMIHNHPSGDPAPSKADDVATKKIKEGLEIVGLKLFDHVIIGDSSYYSYAREGRM